jgi:hypothetical protein
MISAISTAARDTDRRDPHHHPFEVVCAPDHRLRPRTRSRSGLKDLVAAADAFMGGKTVADLKLGPLPKQSTVKVTIVLPELLKEELDAYAAEHSRLYEPVETAALIPHMLEAFLRADRGWRTGRKQRGQGQTGQRRAKSTSDANINDRMK